MAELSKEATKVVRPVGRRVLIEQKMIKKDSSLLHESGTTANGETGYEVSYEVLSLGSDCPTNEVQPGDNPILAKTATEEVAKLISGKMGENVIIMHLIMFYDDIVGVQ